MPGDVPHSPHPRGLVKVCWHPARSRRPVYEGNHVPEARGKGPSRSPPPRDAACGCATFGSSYDHTEVLLFSGLRRSGRGSNAARVPTTRCVASLPVGLRVHEWTASTAVDRTGAARRPTNLGDFPNHRQHPEQVTGRVTGAPGRSARSVSYSGQYIPGCPSTVYGVHPSDASDSRKTNV